MVFHFFSLHNRFQIKTISLFRYDAADMNIFRSALSACCLSGLDRIRTLITFAREQLEPTKKATTISTAPVGTLSAAVGALTATIHQIETNQTEH